ncbi:MAG: preprotein translocase subunit SecA [Candidatus Eremiobacterota bacterium]
MRVTATASWTPPSTWRPRVRRPDAEPDRVTLGEGPQPGHAIGLADLARMGLESACAVLETLPALGASLRASLRDRVTGEAALHAQARRTVAEVRALAPKLRHLSDVQLRARTAEFRARLSSGQTLDDLLPEAFAVAREAAARVTGMRAYDEQVLGGVYAHQGSIVEMKTGEGKTLMEVMPVYLHALTGGGVHVVTANDYLARRDRDWMGPVFERLGLSVGVIHEGQDPDSRRAANAADITYGTASEFGFQYLTDNLAMQPGERVGRDLSKVFALVDEADSLLLDEARTPLLIADRRPEDPRPVQVMAEVVRHLGPGVDFESDPARRTAWLTEEGLDRVEQLLGVGDLYAPANEHLLPYLHAAVQARALYRKDSHYVVHAKQVVLVDEFTGRLKEGHRFAEGLHQAIEAAEGLPVGPSQRTMASITYPNYFRLYRKVSGMTGTAESSREEFHEVFGLPVRGVPTHRPSIRVDEPDRWYPTSAERDRALAEHVGELHRKGQPVLIGTRSIERSQALSAELTRRGIPHQVLNALNAEREASIIAQAGRLGAVTIATNMAGRGVDIKLGGDPEGLPEDAAGRCREERARVLALGGLRVLPTERHEARRIDEQFIGRAGRQGDPGSSQFFLSREDDLFRLFGPASGLAVEDAVARAQQLAESRSLDGRRRLLQFDGAVNLQRQAVYSERNAALEGGDLLPALPGMLDQVVDSAVERHFSHGAPLDRAKLGREVAFLLGGSPERPVSVPAFASGQELKGWLAPRLRQALDEQQRRLGNGAVGEVLREVYLRSLDDEWADQQTALEGLRDGSWMQAYGEKDPLREYAREAHAMYRGMLDRVSARCLHALLSLRPMPGAMVTAA